MAESSQNPKAVRFTLLGWICVACVIAFALFGAFADFTHDAERRGMPVDAFVSLALEHLGRLVAGLATFCFGVGVIVGVCLVLKRMFFLATTNARSIGRCVGLVRHQAEKLLCFSSSNSEPDPKKIEKDFWG